MAKDYFSKKNEGKVIDGSTSELVKMGDEVGSIQAIKAATLNDVSWFKKYQVLRDTANAKADHYKEMALTLFEYQQKDFKNQLDALLISRGKEISRDAFERDIKVNQDLAKLDEQQKEFFEEYIFEFKSRRAKSYNQRLQRLSDMKESGEITANQEAEITADLDMLKKGIDESFVDGITDIMNQNIEFRKKIVKTALGD